VARPKADASTSREPEPLSEDRVMEPPRSKDDGSLIGRQAVREAIRAGRPIRRISIADTAHVHGVLAEILELARGTGIRVDRVPRASLDARARGGMHQGVIADVDAVERAASWRDAVNGARARGEVPLVVALDGIQDPQNLGAIARSAEIFGAHVIVMPDRRSAPLSDAAARAAAGAFAFLPAVRVVNLERTLADLKKDGLWVVALDHRAEMSVDACELLAEPTVLVVGAEGEGVSRLIKERADMTVSIPTSGQIGSLNASAAAAICLWEVARRRGA
jgi:23S rRNA (guanosine2251-2'-O)-methyltransferase